ncbi:MAG: energy transducer TonB [Gammaproteobacteria bacterium]|nr:energy transducer TonB [Gammaproteobacteria bacterium]
MHLTVQLAAVLLASLVAWRAGADDATTVQRDAADNRYRTLIAEGRNAEAVAAGLDVLTLTQHLHGEGSIELASPLTNLATAQLRNGDFLNAETSYQAAIAILEKHAGFLSLRLVNPLVGLGETYIRSEQYVLATEAYEKALHINHVNEGFYNPDQITIRDGLTEGYLGLQDIEQANLHQDAQVYAKQRRLGANSPEVIVALAKLGRWYDRSGQAEQARFAYQNAARLLEKADGDNSKARIDLLLEIADTYRAQALLPPDPDSVHTPASLLSLSSITLQEALNVVEQEQPPDPSQRARILVELGDLYVIWGKRNTAATRYKDAWQALSANPDLETLRDQYFAEPSRIVGPSAPTIFPAPSRNSPPPAKKDLEPGFVVVRFDVNEAGRVVSPTIIEADPANLLEHRVTEAAAKTLYRPRYVDAMPVAATGLVLRHDFRYAPGKLEKKDAPPADEASKPLEQPASGAGS